ncbi:MAG: fibronectin type III domain-containing protein [Bacteroidota bacterium]
MRKLLFSLLVTVALLLGNQSYSQKGVAINNTGADPANSAMLDVSSLTKGVLIPRMTAVQRTAIVSPVKGLLVYQEDGTEGFYYFDGAAWTRLSDGTGTVAIANGGTGTTTGSITGTNALTFTAGGSNQNVTLRPSGTGSIVLQGNTGINTSGSSPDSKAILDLSSTTKGFLPPHMTYLEKTAITSPPAGLMLWCTNCGTSGELQVYSGAAWTNLIGGAASGSVPSAPTIGTATAGDGQASVSFTAPASNGGSAITSYTATSNPGNITGTLSQAGSETINVTGLTNGTAYTFTVKSTNAVGTGAASAASNAVTPVGLAIGQSYGGGIIAYILQSGDPGWVSGPGRGL